MIFFKNTKTKNISPYFTQLKTLFRQKKYESMAKFVAKLSFLKKNILCLKLQKFRLKSTEFFLYEKLKKQISKMELMLYFIKKYDIF